MPTSIRILEKEYVVSCPDGEQEALRASASFLDERMREARDGGNIVGTERIAVMAALNVAHEFLGLKRDRDQQAGDLTTTVDRLAEKLGATIEANRTGDDSGPAAK